MKLPKTLYRAIAGRTTPSFGKDDLIDGVRDDRPYYGYGGYFTPYVDVAKWYQNSIKDSSIQKFQLNPRANLVDYDGQFNDKGGKKYETLGKFIMIKRRETSNNFINNYFSKTPDIRRQLLDDEYNKYYHLRKDIDAYTGSLVSKYLRDNYKIDGWYAKDSALKWMDKEVEKEKEFIILNPSVIKKEDTPFRKVKRTRVDRSIVSRGLNVEGRLGKVVNFKDRVMGTDPELKYFIY